MSEPAFLSLDGRDAGPAAAVLDAIVADAAPAVPERPRTIGVMVASVDGRAAVEGRSGGLTGAEDRAIFRGLRERADALLVGPTTLNREGYSTTLDPPHRAARTAAGLPPEPLVATISRGFGLDADLPLLHDPLMRVVVYSEVDPPYPVDRDRVEVVRVPEASPTTALADLRRRGVERVNCEGGPTLLGSLASDGLLDELLLTVSPLLVGTGGALGPPLTVLSGTVGDAPLPLTLRGTWRSGDVLFLHYHLTHGSSA